MHEELSDILASFIEAAERHSGMIVTTVSAVAGANNEHAVRIRYSDGLEIDEFIARPRAHIPPQS